MASRRHSAELQRVDSMISGADIHRKFDSGPLLCVPSLPAVPGFCGPPELCEPPELGGPESLCAPPRYSRIHSSPSSRMRTSYPGAGDTPRVDSDPAILAAARDSRSSTLGLGGHLACSEDLTALVRSVLGCQSSSGSRATSDPYPHRLRNTAEEGPIYVASPGGGAKVERYDVRKVVGEERVRLAEEMDYERVARDVYQSYGALGTRRAPSTFPGSHTAACPPSSTPTQFSPAAAAIKWRSVTAPLATMEPGRPSIVLNDGSQANRRVVSDGGGTFPAGCAVARPVENGEQAVRLTSVKGPRGPRSVTDRLASKPDAHWCSGGPMPLIDEHRMVYEDRRPLPRAAVTSGDGWTPEGILHRPGDRRSVSATERGARRVHFGNTQRIASEGAMRALAKPDETAAWRQSVSYSGDAEGGLPAKRPVDELVHREIMRAALGEDWDKQVPRAPIAQRETQPVHVLQRRATDGGKSSGKGPHPRLGKRHLRGCLRPPPLKKKQMFIINRENLALEKALREAIDPTLPQRPWKGDRTRNILALQMQAIALSEPASDAGAVGAGNAARWGGPAHTAYIAQNDLTQLVC
ncbi:hypothetical protein HDZ31DRAFT_76383 [Schizophyllum fasciatum]